MMRTYGLLATMALIVCGTLHSQAPRNTLEPARLVLEDQFERKQNISDYRGDVVVLLYGDKNSIDPNRTLGEKLHVQFHPTARGLTPAEARKAPVAPIPGLPEGVRSPGVQVIPVACVGKGVPEVVKGIIRSRLRKEVPDVPVWLDFDDSMKGQFGMKDGEPNLLILDTSGRVRVKIVGQLDQTNYAKVVQAVDFLRKEAAK